jgi:hypothetical protein
MAQTITTRGAGTTLGLAAFSGVTLTSLYLAALWMGAIELRLMVQPLTGFIQLHP